MLEASSGVFTLGPLIIGMHALVLDMCHLQLECFTCGPIYHQFKLLVLDKVHFVIVGFGRSVFSFIHLIIMLEM